MRRVRVTYPGAYHHVMNRGYDGNDIFYGNKCKSQFLDYLLDSAKKMKITVFAYCVMDNHYHLVLENSSGRMSDFLKKLNGLYGMFYRKMFGGHGYVFQGRFKSTLIENDAYLIQAIIYLLQNPVRAGIVYKAEDYVWSSAHYYFSDQETEIVDAELVNELFGSKKSFLDALHTVGNVDSSLRISEYGEILGDINFLKSAFKKFDRRNAPSHQGRGVQRTDEHYFEPVEKVYWEFENKHGIKIENIDTRTHKGKRLRGELLVKLKEKAGLKYKEIGDLELFHSLRFGSLASIYRNMVRSGYKG